MFPRRRNVLSLHARRLAYGEASSAAIDAVMEECERQVEIASEWRGKSRALLSCRDHRLDSGRRRADLRGARSNDGDNLGRVGRLVELSASVDLSPSA
jgi:hypothetical protein